MAFIAGRTPPEQAPIACHFGVSNERADEIIALALAVDLADKRMHQQYLDNRESGTQNILMVRLP